MRLCWRLVGRLSTNRQWGQQCCHEKCASDIKPHAMQTRNFLSHALPTFQKNGLNLTPIGSGVEKGTTSGVACSACGAGPSASLSTYRFSRAGTKLSGRSGTVRFHANLRRGKTTRRIISARNRWQHVQRRTAGRPAAQSARQSCTLVGGGRARRPWHYPQLFQS